MQIDSVTGYNPYAYLKAKETEQVKAVTLRQQTRYMEKAPSANFRDVLNKSIQAEPDLPVADFSGRNEFSTVGDSKRDENIKAAINYYSSCFDFTNKWDYDRLTAEQDFTGMTNPEKYKAVYEKYQHCYGENFLDAAAGDYELIPSEYDFYTPILRQFKAEVNEVCGGEKNAEKARRIALYGEGLSDTEVRQAIIDKYVSDGKITKGDYNKMTNEMDLCGVGGGIGNSNKRTEKVYSSAREYFQEMGISGQVTYDGDKYISDGQGSKSDYLLESYMTEDDFKSLWTAYEHRVYLKNVTPMYGEALTQILGALH